MPKGEIEEAGKNQIIQGPCPRLGPELEFGWLDIYYRVIPTPVQEGKEGSKIGQNKKLAVIQAPMTVAAVPCGAGTVLHGCPELGQDGQALPPFP